MGKRKRTWEPVESLDPGDFIIYLGEVWIIQTMCDGWMRLVPIPGHDSAWGSSIQTYWSGDWFEVPRNHKPLFPGSRNDLLSQIEDFKGVEV